MSTTQIVNFKWPQGEDLNIQLIYREGDTPAEAVPVPLNSGFSLRMDLVDPATKAKLTSIDTDDTDDTDDVTLGSGANGQPNINIFLPRTLTLTGGDLFTSLNAGKNSFAYDIFLRNISTNRQVKILKGTVTVEASNTLWA